jgi:antitoxin component of MazEF toxin-antitoxin module
MREVRKLQKFGGSRALSLPAAWLQMVEGDYGHEITEVEIEDNGATLTIRPLRTFGFDGLKYESNEDAEYGPHKIARPATNEYDPRWKELLGKLEQRGRWSDGEYEYWLIHADRDMHDGKMERVLYGIGRRRVPK